MAQIGSGEKLGEEGIIWDKEIDVPDKWIHYVDGNVYPSMLNLSSYSPRSFRITRYFCSFTFAINLFIPIFEAVAVHLIIYI